MRVALKPLTLSLSKSSLPQIRVFILNLSRRSWEKQRGRLGLVTFRRP